MTVNTELETKFDELSRVNNDIGNLLTNTDIAVIFLDINLCIKFSTPTVTKFFNLIQSDVGRPFSHFGSNLDNEHLVPDLEELLRTLIPKEHEVKTKDGIWYLVRVMPYRTTENVIDGATITFTDITVYKKVEEYRLLATVVRDSNDSVTVQDFSGKLLAWNKGAAKMYGWTEAEALQMNIQDLIPEYKREEELIFRGHLTRGKFVNSLETNRLTKDGKKLTVWLTVTKLVDETGNPTGFATTERNTTEQQRSEDEKRPGQL